MSNHNHSITVAVAMSGGVDSSVAALLLKREGYNVIGCFIKCWEECNSLDYEDVKKVCSQLNIPYYSLNFVDEYKKNVFSHFLKGLQEGKTPNPDILCNREIKFKAFLKKAQKIGADFIATGHYCQNKIIKGEHKLTKGQDKGKDQSYFLYTLKKELLEKIIFPIGALTKVEVRQIAQIEHLATADKKDSMGICFIGKKKLPIFLKNYLQNTPGNIETLNREIIGQHAGLAYYTIGQRKGLKIGGRGEAWFVIKKDIRRNTLVVAQGANHPALFYNNLTANELSWVSDIPPSPFPFKCQAKIRYRQEDQQCIIERIEKGKVFVTFIKPQRAITPNQSIVFYDKQICFGGGIILKGDTSHFEKCKKLTEIGNFPKKKIQIEP